MTMFARIRSSRGTSILGEVLMLVVGINIAFWFEGKFEDIKDAETEQQYLLGLSEDLASDIEKLDSLIVFNESKIERLTALVPQLATLADSLPEVTGAAIFEPSSYDFFLPSDFTYRSMQESGDFRLLSDQQTKEGLLKLARYYRQIEVLQQNFIQALDDSYIPLMMQSFDIAQMRLVEPAILDNLTFRNFYAFAINETQQRTAYCQIAREQARVLLELIKTQLD